MPVRYWFRCDICGVLPDDETRRSIGASTREDLFGELIDAMPGKWLVWHAGGLLGPRRYACPDHRKALLKSIRFHYAYAGEQWVWKRPPYPQRWPPDGIRDEPDGTLTIPEWFAPGPSAAGGRRRLLAAASRWSRSDAGLGRLLVAAEASGVAVLGAHALAHVGDGVDAAAGGA